MINTSPSLFESRKRLGILFFFFTAQLKSCDEMMIIHLCFSDAMLGQLDDGKVTPTDGPLDVVEAHADGVVPQDVIPAGCPRLHLHHLITSASPAMLQLSSPRRIPFSLSRSQQTKQGDTHTQKGSTTSDFHQSQDSTVTRSVPGLHVNPPPSGAEQRRPPQDLLLLPLSQITKE